VAETAKFEEIHGGIEGSPDGERFAIEKNRSAFFLPGMPIVLERYGSLSI